MSRKKDQEPFEVEENPTVDRRQLVKHAKTGDRGYLVKRDGTTMVQLDRPGEQIRPYGSDWIPDVDKQPLSKAQVAQICFAADVELRFALGQRSGPKKWHEVQGEARVNWVSGQGPVPSGIRKKIYDALQRELKGFTK